MPRRSNSKSKSNDKNNKLKSAEPASRVVAIPAKNGTNDTNKDDDDDDGDDDFGGSRCPSFSGERKIGLGFDRVQPKKKLRPMKSFFDGSRENSVGRPPRPPQDSYDNSRRSEGSIGRTDESLRQQQRDEFAMLMQTSNNNRSNSTHKTNIKTKVPSHRRTPTLLRPTVAEEAHSSCHASSDETSNEDLPFVRKKREKPLLDNSSNIDSHRDLARQNHQRHVDRGYSSISSVDNSDPPQRSAVAGHRQLALSHRKPAALKVELLSSRRRR